MQVRKIAFVVVAMSFAFARDTSPFSPPTYNRIAYLTKPNATAPTSSYEISTSPSPQKFTVATMQWHEGLVEGWAHLRLETTDVGRSKLSYGDLYHAAGYLEGFVTATEVLQTYHNTFSSTSLNNTCVRKHAQAFLDASILRATQRPPTEYDSVVNAMLLQMQGLATGVEAAADVRLSLLDVLIMNVGQEIEQLDEVRCGNTSPFPAQRSVAVIKKVKKNILIGHATHAPYRSMIHRHIKSYHFAWDRRVTMTGYPGRITSTDDFLIVGRSLVLLSLPLPLYDTTASDVSTSDVLPRFLRLSVAAILSKSAVQFVQTFERGAHADVSSSVELLVLDVNESVAVVMDGSPVPLRSAFLVNQVNGATYHHDLSLMLNTAGYYAGVGLPTLKSAIERSGMNSFNDSDHRRWSNPRSALINRHIARVHSPHGLLTLLRRNRWETDGSPWCAIHVEVPCLRTLGPLDAIAPRGDVSAPNHTVTPYGAIDAKATSLVDVLRSIVALEAGPPAVGGEDIPVVGLANLQGAPAGGKLRRHAVVTFVMDPRSHPRGVQETIWHPSLNLTLVVAVVGIAAVVGVIFLSERRDVVHRASGYAPLA